MAKEEKKDICLYPFDPQKDIAPVDQFGFINLREAFINHSIPGDLVMDDQAFNGVDDPDSLLGSSRDVFEAYRKANYVTSKNAAKSAAEAKAAAATSSDPE